MARTKHGTTTVLDEAKYLLPEQAARLRAHLDDEVAAALANGGKLRLRNAALAHVLLGSGLRISEAVALLVGDLVLDGPRRYLRVLHGKGDKARDVTIGADLRGILRRYLDAHRPAGLDTPLFPAGGGSRCMSRISGWRAWKKFLRKLQLDAPGRGCHAARHTRATLLYAATRDLRLVGRELGHSDTRTTLVYADSLGEDRAAAAEAIDERFRLASTTSKPAGSKLKQIRSTMKQNSAFFGAK